MNTSTTTRSISATPQAVYRAFTDADILVRWQAPDTMTAKIHHFDHRLGGSYEMSLTYQDTQIAGKSGDNVDRYTATFLELDEPRRIVESIEFAGDDPSLAEPMTMIVDLSPDAGGTRVTLIFENLPPTVAPADNDIGTQQSLAKLAALLER